MSVGTHSQVAKVGVVTLALFASALPAQAAAQELHPYKLVILGTLGGPQSYSDPDHGAANINNEGMVAGVAATAIPDPFFPNFNPGFAGLIGQNPFVYH